MGNPTISTPEFIEQLKLLGATELARRLGISERAIYQRKANLKEHFINEKMQAPIFSPPKYEGRVDVPVRNGYVVVGSDFHIWPGDNGVMLRAFIKFIDDIRPAAVVLNGDVLDFPKISRHPPIGWEKMPHPQEEIEYSQDYLADVARAARRARKVWTLGNHDARFETKLATVAPEFAKVAGIHLSDHFPLWEKAWSCWVNDNTVIKHRFKGGLHAPHNNTLWAGKHIVTGHLHSQKVQPITDYNGVRYGVDTGCVADPRNRAFVNYTEDNPLNWRSGFAVLRYVDGQLLLPQLVGAWDDRRVQYRGELVRV